MSAATKGCRHTLPNGLQHVLMVLIMCRRRNVSAMARLQSFKEIEALI